MPQFDVTNLDFDQIKESIKTFFSNQDTYNDWDFDGSGLSVLLDVLAYNTHYNALLSHFTLNEAFLDSAQIRGNIVSHAKLLGYVPRSVLASTAVVDVEVTPLSGVTANGTLPRGTRFRTKVDSNQYNFVTLEDITEIPVVDGKYSFSGVTLKQGALKRMIYRVDNSIPNQKFIIPDENVDTSTIRVRVKQIESSTVYSVYTPFSSLIDINADSQIYFIQENTSEQYEIYFGDGVLGKKPNTDNIVEIEYVYTKGTVANGATEFTPLDTIEGSSNIAVTLDTKSYGGAAKEGIESIRYNAPITFMSQNRAVTADDYRGLITQGFEDIDAITVWGGENNVEPDYGQVYISIKPKGAATLTQTQKDYIIQNVLKNKNVVSITPNIIDPEFTYLSLDINFKYNPNLTDVSKSNLESKVATAISTYNDDNLKKFDGVFRNSQLLGAIDDSDSGILNSSSRVFMYKNVTLAGLSMNNHSLNYSGAFLQNSNRDQIITSTGFLRGYNKYYIGDWLEAGTEDIRKLYVYKIVPGTSTKVKLAEIGTVDLLNGTIAFDLPLAYAPSSSTTIKIFANPNSYDVAPARNHLLEIDTTQVTITGEIDTIAVSGTAGANNYTTTAKNRS